MSAASSRTNRTNQSVQINPSQGDRVNAILIASLVMFGFLFSVLFLVWWFFEPPVQRGGFGFPPPPPSTPILPLEEEIKLDLIEFESSEAKAFENLIETTTPSVEKYSDANGSFGDGLFPGIGTDPRLPSPAGVAVPRWNVVQEASDLESYQRKLDFFGIEIGAVHKTRDQVLRIAKLSTEKNVTESTRSAQSGFRYFVSQKKRLQQWDRQTIRQAGVDLQDVIAVHFYPDELVAEMQRLIDVEYGDRSGDLQEVTFKIAGTGGDFCFEIDSVNFGK